MLTRPGWSHLIIYVATAVVVAASSGLSTGSTAAASQQGTPKQLLGTLYVTDKKDVPLTDVTASELEVKENGQSRRFRRRSWTRDRSRWPSCSTTTPS